LKHVWIASAIVAGALALALLDSDSGLRTWARMRADLRVADERMSVLRDEIEALRAESKGLESDSFAQERAIRQDLGLARPGETVVRLGRDEPSLRNP